MEKRWARMRGLDLSVPFVIAALDAAIHETICPMDYPIKSGNDVKEDKEGNL